MSDSSRPTKKPHIEDRSDSSRPTKKPHIEEADGGEGVPLCDNKMEAEQSSFMEKLFNLDYRNILYTVENILNSPFNGFYRTPTESDRLSYQSTIDYHCLKPPLQGVDLGDVKHYQHSELIRYVGRGNGAEIGNNLHACMFLGIVNYGGEERQVLIKTWKVHFPPTSSNRALQPARLYNEIQLLTKEPMKSHPNVPRLIGYSIDKMLAVVYDFGAKHPLRRIIREDVALCTRVSMAAKIGRILQSFHDKGIVIGCIESHSIMLDQEDNIYFCDFGLSDSLVARLSKVNLKATAVGGYGFYAPEIESPQIKSTLEMDIYAYGILVLELVKGEGTLTHKLPLDLLGSDVSILGFDINQLVKRCLSENPMERPKIGDVAVALEKFNPNLLLQHDVIE